MPFNSLQFAAFFIIVFFLYLALKHKWQNRLLLLASCVFYAAWDWRFLGLVFISITTDYLCSLKIHASDSEKIKKRFLILSILINLSVLGFFKYFNFFSANLAHLINLLGFTVHPYILNIILPIGISFYTFKTMSYTIDVYTGKTTPTRSYPDYALFVIFFPLLLAGPIMRAGDLLPQISSPRKLSLDKFYEGSYLIFWGLFQKVFVADNLAIIADKVFNTPAPYNGVAVLLATYAFAFQIYCDFAGYSNMAMGIGKCIGFEITLNFNLPYFATNPQDFWQRWHITLSTWLRDYLYIPISFSLRRWGAWGIGFALMATFLLCGLWHGASWQFILWGAYWGVLIILYTVLKPLLAKIRGPKSAFGQKLWLFLRIGFFFQLTSMGWLIFNARGVRQSFSMAYSIITNFKINLDTLFCFINIFQLIWLLLLIQWMQFIEKDRMVIYKSNILVRAVFYIICFYAIVLYGAGGGKDFIYLQF